MEDIRHYDADGFIAGRTIFVPTRGGSSIHHQEAIWEDGFFSHFETVTTIHPECQNPYCDAAHHSAENANLPCPWKAGE